MDKVYQVFISSTFTDLQEERKQVSDTLAKAGFLTAGMELFPAVDEDQFDYIKRVIDRSDYYIVIVAGRYGTVDGKKSFTEKEYLYAREKKIPVLAFIHSHPGKLAADKCEIEASAIKALEAFRARLRTSRMVVNWSSSTELPTAVLTAVANSVNLFPRIGWIRGDQAIDPKLLQELERLRLENQEFRAELALLRNSKEITFPEELAGPDDVYEYAILSRPKESNDGEWTELGRPVEPWRDIFFAIGNSLLREQPEHEIFSTLCYHGSRLLDKFSQNLDFKVPPSHVFDIRFHLEALGLVRIISKNIYPDNYLAWTVTEKGRIFLQRYFAIRKEDTTTQSSEKQNNKRLSSKRSPDRVQRNPRSS